MSSKLMRQMREHKDIKSRKAPVRTAWALAALCDVVDVLIEHAPQHAKDKIDEYFEANKEGV